MSLPASAIEQLQGQFRLKQDDWFEACKEIDRLNDVVQKQKETIESLEIAVATMRRRLESLEGVT